LLEYGVYVNGQWEQVGRERIQVTNPANGEVVGLVPSVGRDVAARAVSAAAEAFRTWSRLSAGERSAALFRWHDLIERNKEELARILTIEQGKPLAEARAEVADASGYVAWYAAEAQRIYGETIPGFSANRRIVVLRQPVGVAAAITPWNFPASMVTRKMAPALAAGCTVVLKPASQTPLTAAFLMDLFHQAGFPAGVANLITGPATAIGQEFLDNPLVRKISFTGSTDVGKTLMQGAAAQVKRVSMELGGHAPILVFADADLSKAVSAAVRMKYLNAGQTCICINRILVEESIAEEFTRLFIAKVEKLRVGNGLVDGTQMGPLIDQNAIATSQAHVADAVEKGAKVATGGTVLQEGEFSRGNFYAPTVLTGVTPDMLITREETFGPVAPIMTFKDEDEAIALANDSVYGLASYLYTRDLSRAWRVSEQLEYGMVGLNDIALGAVQAPFGGVKQSGIGREGGHHGLDEYLETKQIALAL
jgi:succinate-semialdehyde dehydrogenase/glutarate-semialdehyde dehydrogenase